MVQPPNFQLEKSGARGYKKHDRYEALLGLAHPFFG